MSKRLSKAEEKAFFKKMEESIKTKPNGDRFTFYTLVVDCEMLHFDFREFMRLEEKFILRVTNKAKFPVTLSEKGTNLRPNVYEVRDSSKPSAPLLKNYKSECGIFQTSLNDDGSKDISVRFNFNLDAEGSVLMDQMLDYIKHIKPGTLFDNGDILGISMLDHIIFTEDNYISLKESGRV